MVALRKATAAPEPMAVVLARSLINTGENVFSRALVMADFEEQLAKASTLDEQAAVARQYIALYVKRA